MSKVIFAVAGDGRTILNQMTVDDAYALAANEQTDGQGMLPLNPCSYFDGTQRQVMPGKWAALQALQATDAALSRTEEDIIDTAIAKGSYALADLPAATQARYAAKKAARAAYLAL